LQLLNYRQARIGRDIRTKPLRDGVYQKHGAHAPSRPYRGWAGVGQGLAGNSSPGPDHEADGQGCGREVPGMESGRNYSHIMINFSLNLNLFEFIVKFYL
jgi:hypothetical protein